MRDSTSTTPRRVRLRAAAKLLLAAGAVLAAAPFVGYLLPQASRGAAVQAQWALDVDVRDMAVGEVRPVDWRGGRVWVLRRGPAQLTVLSDLAPALVDPESRHSRQPEAARTPWRSLDPEYFVFMAREPRRGCMLRQAGTPPPGVNAPWAGGFYEPCGGAWFDPAGRVYRGTGAAGQPNLAVPEYRIAGPGRIRLLAPSR